MRWELEEWLEQQNQTDRMGSVSDVMFVGDDSWLFDTVVVEKEIFKNGQWELHLLYVHPEYPLKFVKRKMITIGKRAPVANVQKNTTSTALDISFFEISSN